jgi:hypothetical protein
MIPDAAAGEDMAEDSRDDVDVELEVEVEVVVVGIFSEEEGGALVAVSSGDSMPLGAISGMSSMLLRFFEPICCLSDLSRSSSLVLS